MSSGPFLRSDRAAPYRYTVAGANAKARPDAGREGALWSNLTPEDRATYLKWVRVVAALYACAALLLLLAAITFAAPVQPPGSVALAAPMPGHCTDAASCDSDDRSL